MEEQTKILKIIKEKTVIQSKIHLCEQSVWQGQGLNHDKGKGSTNLRLYCRLRFSPFGVHRTRIHDDLVLNRISNPLSSWISYEFKEREKEAGEQT